MSFEPDIFKRVYDHMINMEKNLNERIATHLKDTNEKLEKFGDLLDEIVTSGRAFDVLTGADISALPDPIMTIILCHFKKKDISLKQQAFSTVHSQKPKHAYYNHKKLLLYVCDNQRALIIAPFTKLNTTLISGDEPAIVGINLFNETHLDALSDMLKKTARRSIFFTWLPIIVFVAILCGLCGSLRFFFPNDFWVFNNTADVVSAFTDTGSIAVVAGMAALMLYTFTSHGSLITKPMFKSFRDKINATDK